MPGYVRYVVEKLALGQGFIQVLRFAPSSITPRMLQTHFHRNTSPVRRTSGRGLGAFKQSNALSNIGEYLIQKHFHTLPGFRRRGECRVHCLSPCSLPLTPCPMPHCTSAQFPLSSHPPSTITRRLMCLQPVLSLRKPTIKQPLYVNVRGSKPDAARFTLPGEIKWTLVLRDSVHRSSTRRAARHSDSKRDHVH